MNYRLDISYDGSKYKGWQRQKSTDRTIQGKIEETLSKYFGKNIEITGASRTDAGVHAKGQTANFKINENLDEIKLCTALNNYLPQDIIINEVHKVSDRFHSRFNAAKKTYTYTIWRVDAKYPPLFERKYVYCYDTVIDVDKLYKDSQLFVGRHDFKGFSSDKTKKSTTRTIESINVVSDDFKIKIEITGDGFLYNMIRILVGTLLEINRGDIDREVVEEIFNTQNRELAGFTAPASGLFLETIYY